MSSEPRKEQPKRPHLFFYMVVLFAVAFLLLLVSYFMQQRQSDQQVIDGLEQKNMSSMQIAQNVIERNQTLMEENKALREKLDQLEENAETFAAQQEEQKSITLALDWLWRIEREYFQGRYSNARALIREMEANGLHAFLPAQALADQEYRTPLEQYQAIRDLLF